ncbi:unnamed protein product [Polarella glacialis]|uniref:Uncharacterized protein n=1 Tax=Polarella glacialis TaxID=89957 RepID=A0A813JKH7_POLGL|nr:unnamed protein product [Polarella glacialis]CAE8678762.1 unnamed protein product [Polarella glacialis]|mmetsp:Transcript_6043/g.9679  ORF Transcript_6043/g.9679 Transcript_6043/m.9679 type:complete len:166 (+) Transcript_6043:127-624(+)
MDSQLGPSRLGASSDRVPSGCALAASWGWMPEEDGCLERLQEVLERERSLEVALRQRLECLEVELQEVTEEGHTVREQSQRRLASAVARGEEMSAVAAELQTELSTARCTFEARLAVNRGLQAQSKASEDIEALLGAQLKCLRSSSPFSDSLQGFLKVGLARGAQ